MEKKYLLTTPGQRVDQPDIQALSNSVEAAGAADNFVLLGAASYIVDGFIPSGTSGAATVTVTRDASTSRVGRAVLARRTSAGVEHGHLLAGGATSKSLDVGGLADGAHSLYIRFDLVEGDQGNVVLWNPDSTAGGPIEVTQPLNTRKSADWAITVTRDAIGSPGAEWLKIGTFTVASGVLSADAVDARQLLFEGSVASSYDEDLDWGDGANDRNADRASYGVQDLRTLVRALQRQVKDIIGGTTPSWYKDPQGGSAKTGAQSLTQINELKFERDGSYGYEGNLYPDSTGTLGTSAAPWTTAYAKSYNFDPAGSTAYTHVLTGRDATLNPAQIAAGTVSLDAPSTPTRSRVILNATGSASFRVLIPSAKIVQFDLTYLSSGGTARFWAQVEDVVTPAGPTSLHGAPGYVTVPNSGSSETTMLIPISGTPSFAAASEALVVFAYADAGTTLQIYSITVTYAPIGRIPV